MFSETIANKTGFKTWKSNVCSEYDLTNKDSIQEPLFYPCVVVYSVESAQEFSNKERIEISYVYQEDFTSDEPELEFLKWVVEFEVEKGWVKDGFDLTDERAKAMLENELPWAYSHELKTKIISKPDKRHIKKIQGYIKSR